MSESPSLDASLVANPAIKALDKQLQQPWSGNRTRSCFIEYFEVKRAHPFWASSPVVPVNDPTLLFTNAGMNQFKPIFLGTVEPTSELGKLSRAANSQVCAGHGDEHCMEDLANMFSG